MIHRCSVHLILIALLLLPVPVLKLTADTPSTILLHNEQKVAFMGDSITAFGTGFPGGYVKLVVDALGRQGVKIELIPAGVSGNTSKDMLERLNRDVLSKKPDWMTLSCGVNDVWHGVNGVDLETYKKNITSIIDQATAAGIKVILLTATPIGEDDNDNNKKLAAYNDFLRQLAAERKLPLADLNKAFQTAMKDDKRTPDSRNLTVDGVHMNPEGNIVMARGVLLAMGVIPTDMDKIEAAWAEEPNNAFLSFGNVDPRPGNMPLSLAQFREIEKAAKDRGVNFEQLSVTLWLQSLAEVLPAHAQDAIIDTDALKKEVGSRLLAKIDALPTTPAPAPNPAK